MLFFIRKNTLYIAQDAANKIGANVKSNLIVSKN